MEFPEDVLKTLAPATGPGLLKALAACGFTPAGYLAMHDDLTSTGMTAYDALGHYFRFGQHEGRHIPVSPRIDDLLPLLRVPIADAKARRTILFQFWTNQERAADEATDWDADVTTVSAALFDAGALPYVVLGDSHSHCYSKPMIHADRLLAPIHMLCSGGSALGLANAKSRSGYGNAIREFFSRQASQADRSPVRYLFKFGQVDAEFVSVFRRIQLGQTRFTMTDFERFARDSVTRYEAFLGRLLEIFPHPDRIKVCGIFPPALADATWRTGYVNAHIAFLETGQQVESLAQAVRDLEIPDLLTRTHMHALYNGLLQVACARLGLTFINDFTPLLSGAGVVERTWTGGNVGNDHHLAPEALHPIIGALVTTHATPNPWGTSPYARDAEPTPASDVVPDQPRRPKRPATPVTRNPA